MNERLNPMYAPCPYAVGDILTTRNAANPSTRWPGTTWKTIETFLLGASTKHPAGSTGGAESVTSGGTAITTEHLPFEAVIECRNLTGAAANPYGQAAPDRYSVAARSYVWSKMDNLQKVGLIDQYGQPHTHTVETMPPYTAVYIWERTA